MKRVFAIDVLECPRCRGRMRILAAIQPPDTTSAILACMGLPVRAPPLAPAQIDKPRPATQRRRPLHSSAVGLPTSARWRSGGANGALRGSSLA